MAVPIQGQQPVSGLSDPCPGSQLKMLVLGSLRGVGHYSGLGGIWGMAGQQGQGAGNRVV